MAQTVFLLKNILFCMLWFCFSIQPTQSLSIDRATVEACVNISNSDRQEFAFYFETSSLSCAQCPQNKFAQTVSEDGNNTESLQIYF